jgi:hypothetical protein
VRDNRGRKAARALEKHRVHNAKRRPMSGWDQMRARLIGEFGRPTMFFFPTCSDSIRTISVLQHDPERAEDLDTNSEDHAADDVRYACLSRSWLKAPAEKTAPKDGYRAAGEELQNDSFKTM